MITTSEQYLRYLKALQNPPFGGEAIELPEGEKIYKIDLETRKVEAPSFISVTKDYEAEIIFFECPRYYDNMDLANTTCIVKYINGNGDSNIYRVPYFDNKALVDEENPRLLFPWVTKGWATAYPGEVKFAFEFYVLGDDVKYEYSLNTQQAKTSVLPGLAFNENGSFEDLDPEATLVQDIYQQLSDLQKLTTGWDIYWEKFPKEE